MYGQNVRYLIPSLQLRKVELCRIAIILKNIKNSVEFNVSHKSDFMISLLRPPYASVPNIHHERFVT